MFVVSAKVLEGSKIFQPLPSLVNSVATIFSYPVAIVKEQAPIYIYIYSNIIIYVYIHKWVAYMHIYIHNIYTNILVTMYMDHQKSKEVNASESTRYHKES